MSLDFSRQHTYGGDEQQPQDRTQASRFLSQRQNDPLQAPTYGPDPVRPPPDMLTQQYPQPLPQQANTYLQDPTMTWQQYHSPVPAPPALQPPHSSRWPTHLSITLPQNIAPSVGTSSPMSLPYSAAHSVTSPLPPFAAPFYPDGSPFPSPGLPRVISPGVHSAMSSSLSAVSPPLPEYFPQYQPNLPPSFQPPLVPPRSGATSPSKRHTGLSRSTSTGSQGRSGAKTTRQQFTACGACKHRRVACDLKDRQAAAERHTKKGGKKSMVSCSNCIARGINCVDEFAPIKAAKQLRRGKRISEIEILYGIAGGGVANPDDTFEGASLTKDELKLPELGQAFWQSAWLRGFVQHRPVIDLANPPSDPLLHHVLYAFAVSCGIDESGSANSDEVVSPTDTNVDYKNELRRQSRFERLKPILDQILREIDASGALRKPQWDTARALVLLLPLMKEHLSPLEVQSISDAAYSHIVILTKDRLHGSEVSTQDHLSELRVVWHAFISEGLTSGQEERRLHLDYILADRLYRRTQPTAANSADVMNLKRMMGPYLSASEAAGLLHPFLLHPQAAMSNETFTQVSGLLERGWHGAEVLSFDQSMESDASVALEYRLHIFTVYNTLHTVLQNRISGSASFGPGEAQRFQQWIESSQAKCSTLSKVLVDVLRNGTSVLSYGSSTTDDAIYLTGKWLVRSGGSAEDVGVCTSILSESPWCLSKAWARIAELRDDLARRSVPPMQQWSLSPSLAQGSTTPYIHPPMLLPTSVKVEMDDTQTMGYPAHQTQLYYSVPYNQPVDPITYNRQFWQPSEQNPQQRG